MKTLFFTTLLFFGFLTIAQTNNTSTPIEGAKNQISLGYGVSNIGRAIHLNYGYQFNQNLFYAGLRLHQDANVNPLQSENYNAYRYDVDGTPFGFNIGYQRYINLKNSALKPFAFTELQYAYLGQQLTFPDYGGRSGYAWLQDAENQFLYSLGIGFEVKLYKNLLLKQSFAGAVHFDNNYKGTYSNGSYFRKNFVETFNGIGLNIQGGLAYIF